MLGVLASYSITVKELKLLFSMLRGEGGLWVSHWKWVKTHVGLWGSKGLLASPLLEIVLEPFFWRLDLWSNQPQSRADQACPGIDSLFSRVRDIDRTSTAGGHHSEDVVTIALCFWIEWSTPFGEKRETCVRTWALIRWLVTRHENKMYWSAVFSLACQNRWEYDRLDRSS